MQLRRDMAILMVLLLLPQPQIAYPLNQPTSALPIRDQLSALKVGTNVTITLSDHKKVTGKLVGKTEDTLQLRVGRSFFRHRTETHQVADIVAVKKRMPTWVGPVIVLGVVGGIVIGVAACVSSGACLN